MFADAYLPPLPNYVKAMAPMMLGAIVGGASWYLYRRWKERFADVRYWGQPFDGIDMLCFIGAQHEVP